MRTLAQYLAGQPWAVDPDHLAALANRDAPLPEHINARLAEPTQPRSRLGQRGPIALATLHGAIEHRPSFWTLIGGTALITWVPLVVAAIQDPDISAVIIDVDSPGGAAYGLQEAAEEIHRAVQRTDKPVIAIANTLAASAAYWLASAAKEVYATPSAEVGSIGVYTVHMDATQAWADVGVKWTLIRSAPHKGEGSDVEPLTDDVRATMQARVDSYHQDFVRAIARYRSRTEGYIEENFGQGRALRAKDAQRVGMIDGVSTLGALIKRLGGEPTPADKITRPPGKASLHEHELALQEALATLQ